MQISKLDPADEHAVRGWYDVRAAAQQVDLPGDPAPGWRSHVAGVQLGWGGERPEIWVALDEAGSTLGGYKLQLPTHDNTHAASAEPTVHPGHRRRGLGRALAQHAADRVRAEGRRVLIGETAEASAGPAFAAVLGAERGLIDVRRVLDLAPGDAARFAELQAKAAVSAAGYELVRWAGPIPEEHLDDVAALMTRMSDAPMDDLDWGQESWPPQRLRTVEAYTALAQDREYVVTARHQASGRLVALTRVFVRADHPEWSSQGDTVVLPEHRGHRLGLLVKAAMLPWLLEREPEVRRLETWNAGSNAHMIAVNEALGYHVLDRWHEWQLRLEPSA